LKIGVLAENGLKVRTFNVAMPHWDYALPGPQFSSFKAASQYQILDLSATHICTSFYGIYDLFKYYFLFIYLIDFDWYLVFLVLYLNFLKQIKNFE